jgi:RNA polymerase sigma factor (sigma-70 family)
MHSDIILIQASLNGDKASLEQLIKQHQDWMYNVAINLTANAADAADLTQEALIKVITNLSKFQNKSSFRTWVYRILKNTFLNQKRTKSYHEVIPWEGFAAGLEQIEDETDSSKYEKEIVEEAKFSCMKGMLLCLTPEQRLVYVMGEMFELSHTQAAEILEITKANFRKKLSRIRQQLYNFMNAKCGLVNKNNPCRCARKTTGFIKKGYVNPDNLQFQKRVLAKIENSIEDKLADFEEDVYAVYKKLFHQHNFQEPEDGLVALKEILA